MLIQCNSANQFMWAGFLRISQIKPSQPVTTPSSRQTGHFQWIWFVVGLKSISKIPLHGFLWGLRQHPGGAAIGIPIAADVACIIISPNFLTFNVSWGSAGPLCVSSSQCRISMTHIITIQPQIIYWYSPQNHIFWSVTHKQLYSCIDRLSIVEALLLQAWDH